MTRFGHKLNYVIKTFVKHTPGLVGKIIIFTTLFKVNMFITNNYNTT